MKHHKELVKLIKELKKILGKSGVYSICRSDGRNLDLSEIMAIGSLFEAIDEQLEQIDKGG